MKTENKTKSVQPAEPRTPAVVRETNPMDEFYRFFDDMFVDRWMLQPGFLRNRLSNLGLFGAEQPQVDIIDAEKEVIVNANLPGVKKEDIDISVTENTLTIKATKKLEREEKHGEYFRREISQGEYSRTLTLPAEVNCETASAVYNDGVLKLTLPKIKSTKRQTVKIQ